jgi:hypothetical protein
MVTANLTVNPLAAESATSARAKAGVSSARATQQLTIDIGTS